ncbi:MAG TPA: hypothetical protein VJO52_05190, partial [Gemmatimonadaceae bacterium]|nr:hypothetical protein [Gemmatimonadaceae bacterium]
LCHKDHEKETEGSLGCAEPRAAARGEMSVVVEKQNGGWSPTDAHASLGARAAILPLESRISKGLPRAGQESLKLLYLL